MAFRAEHPWALSIHYTGRMMDGVRAVGVPWLEDSRLGKNAVVRRGAGNHGTCRLIVGEDSEVEL